MYYLYLQVPRPSHNGTILSYKHDSFGDLLSMRSGPTLEFRVGTQRVDTGFYFQPDEWHHVVWAWESRGKYVISASVVTFKVLTVFKCNKNLLLK